MSLKIALIVHTFEVGGLERSVSILADRLDRSRFQPMVICLSHSGAAAKWIERNDVPIIEVNKKSGNDLAAIRRFASILREAQPDVVHSHNWGTLVETVAARKWARVPVHVHAERGTIMGTLSRRGMRARLRAMTMNWALRRSTAVVTNASATGCRITEACGYPLQRITVIPNGVDVPRGTLGDDARQTLRRELGIAEEAFVFGSVGRLVGVKNYSLAIDALSRMTLPERPAHLVLVGDGPDRNQLQSHASQRGVADRVHFAGSQSNVGDWLSMMDTFVNTSLSEGMSQSIVEAMAAGLPLVVTDVGDNALLAGHVEGSVIASRDVAALATSLRLLADSPERRALRSAENRARYARDYGLGRMVQDYETFYEGLFGSTRERAATPHRATRHTDVPETMAAAG